MKFVIDQQLPSRLVDVLTELGQDAVHVKTLSLTEARDATIWARARELGATIVTKDEDFMSLASADQTGPKVVRIRLGNCPNSVLYERLRMVLPRLIEELAVAQIVEIRSVDDADR